jgi:hypothetical protein
MAKAFPKFLIRRNDKMDFDVVEGYVADDEQSVFEGKSDFQDDI